MGFLLSAIAGVCGLVSLVCFVMVLLAMFKNDQAVLGIICIVAFFFCGFGMLVAFIFGWIKASQWDIQKIMLVWTVAGILGMILGGSSFSFGPAQ